ncbi:MAG: rhomboid family intramembrane serine protease [Lachnoclostridium sp.]|nr:rhomboid family intramembrane serine protease [Lachnospira sp.]MCM1246953.1 rhomboid family intramembrane serine protease [Lachnoclostridium sp.]MCM1536016.1 rhomboid family intramembrane serine protease [Clostridium sp.]
MPREYLRRLNNLKYLPIVSILLVGTNVIVFVLCTFTGDLLYNKGELSLWGVIGQKQYLRILWSLFLHGDINHIFNNMLILFFLGAMIEKEVGHFCYAAIYFVSGIGGNLVSLWYKGMINEQVGSIGASGALFGLDGLLLAMVLFSRRRMESVTPVRVVLMIVYSLYGGFTGNNIDNAAHVGGLLIGFMAGTLMCLAQKNTDKEVQI